MRTAYTVSVDARDGVDDRHLGGRPGAHDPGARRLGHRAVRARPARATCSRCAPRGRRAGPAGAHRGGGRPGPARRADAGRRDRRAGQRRRHDEARLPRAACVRRRARPGAGLHRGPDPLPAAHTRRQVQRVADDPAADAVRRLPRARLPQHCRRRRSTSPWCAATSATGSDVLVRLHSECLTGDVFGSLRCDCGPQLHAALRAGRRARAAASWSTCAATRGAASGCCTSCRRTRCRTAAATPSTPTSTSGCRPTPATTAPARRSCTTSASRSVRLLTNNPDKRAGARGLRHRRRRADAAAGARRRREHRATCATKRDRMGHDLRASSSIDPDDRRRRSSLT